MGGVRLTQGQARQAKRVQHSRAFPDLFIYEARKGFNGLAIELKRDGTKLYLKDGKTLVANPHYREQALMLAELQARGYQAVFCCGFPEFKKLVDDYLA